MAQTVRLAIAPGTACSISEHAAAPATPPSQHEHAVLASTRCLTGLRELELHGVCFHTVSELARFLLVIPALRCLRMRWESNDDAATAT
ncbi:hypothetical protein C8Q80DRAFT_1212076 [Daedaleopsis nitida]|nr:hypothetical protein C8Q80DRAFT_1212076 [Daedaleopsis nitida]